MSLYIRVEQDCLAEKIFKFNGFEQEFGRDRFGHASSDPEVEEFRIFVINNNYYCWTKIPNQVNSIKNNSSLTISDCNWKFLNIPEAVPARGIKAFRLSFSFGIFSRQINLLPGRRYLLGRSVDADITVDLPEIPDKYFYLQPHAKTLSIEMCCGDVLINNSRKVIRRGIIKDGDSIKLLPFGIKTHIELYRLSH